MQVWFYAIFLFISTRHGVSGMELHRQLGVTRKCAYRMGMQIRELMNNADYQGMLGSLEGHVELDEAYVGGRRAGKRGRGAAGKTIVFGMKERSGFIRTEVLDRADTNTLREVFRRNIDPFSIVSTDEYAAYNLLDREGYIHGRVQHNIKEYANTDEKGRRHHVNGVENFWKLFKASVRSTHVQISKTHADKYLNEFCFRQNHREMGNAMFDLLLAAV